MSTMTLYSNPQSRGRITRWMLEETGQPYELVVLEFGTTIKSPEYLAINPMGKVPALVDGDAVITEVAAICTWLAERFPEKGLIPPQGSPERAAFYRWMFFIAGPMEMALSAKAYQWRIDEENVTAVGCGEPDKVFDIIEEALRSKPYLCGDHFTAADLLLSSYLGWEMMMKAIPERKVFVDYVQKCEAREAAKRADALDNALIGPPAE